MMSGIVNVSTVCFFYCCWSHCRTDRPLWHQCPRLIRTTVSLSSFIILSSSVAHRNLSPYGPLEPHMLQTSLIIATGQRYTWLNSITLGWSDMKDIGCMWQQSFWKIWAFFFFLWFEVCVNTFVLSSSLNYDSMSGNNSLKIDDQVHFVNNRMSKTKKKLSHLVWKERRWACNERQDGFT